MTRVRLLALARPYRGALLVAMALMAAQAAVTLVLPWLGGRLAGQLLSASGGSPGPVAGLLLLGLAVAATLRAVVAVVCNRTSARILAGLRAGIHDHLLRLPLATLQRQSQGDLLALTTTEIAHLGNYLADTLVSLPAQLLTAVGAVALMALVDPWLALAVPLLTPLFYVALRLSGRRLRRLGGELQAAEAAVVVAAAEDLAMAPAVKAFTREAPSSRRYAARVEAARDLMFRQSDHMSVVGSVLSFVAAAAALGLLTLAGRGLREGATTPAELASFLLYAVLLTQPIAQLAAIYGQTQWARGLLGRLSALLDEPAEAEPAEPVPLARARGEVAFQGVTFAYEGREPALRGVTLRLRPGETVALTGPNGAGKSTIAALILRFADPSEGRVTLDGIDLRDLALRDLRRQVALVPQRPLLFDASVRDNIAFGREGATEAEIAAAARTAQAHDFIAALPEGYDTRIGENGVRLSGGQGQRIALARALLKDPPILILDEATSMYDLDAEGAFVAAVAAGLRDRTVLLITHRPATLALADRVVALRDGAIETERTAA